MKKLLVIVLIGGFVNVGFSSKEDSDFHDSVVVIENNVISEIEPSPVDSVSVNSDVKVEQAEKSLEQQAEEIPVVFGQWWFWVGLFAIILFLKFVIFKK